MFDGRVYVVIIDDLQTAFERTPRTRVAARKFIEENMGANDLMAVVHTAGPSDANQDFTNNKRLLLAAVDKTIGQKLDVGLQQLRASNAARSIDAVRDIAQWLSGVRGRRKTILLFSEGIDYDLANVFDRFGGSLGQNMREAVASAVRGNVSVFAIDPRGLAVFGDETLPDVSQRPFPDSILGSGRPNNQALRISQDNLREIAEETGGFAAINANDFSTAFDRIVRDNSSYYVLAYYPQMAKPGKEHRIDVRVKLPGAAVRARRAYVTPGPAKASTEGSKNAPKTKATPEVLDALSSPIPISGLTMYAYAAPFRGPGQNASVLVGTEIRGRDMALTEDDTLSLSYRAIDTQSKIRGGNDQAVTLNLKPEEKALFQENGFRFLNRVELPPGRYQLRVAAHDSGSGKVGTVIYDLDVPDFSKGALSMSGIAITSTAGSVQPTLRADPQLVQVLPGPPIGRRTFQRDDEMALFAEVYDNQGSTKGHKVEITATVTTDEGKVLFKNNEVRESSELGGKRGGYGYTTRIPLKDLAPGRYVLTVSARSTLGDGSTVQRQVQFTIGGRG